MWSVESFLNPKIGQQKLAYKSKNLRRSEVQFSQNVMSMAAAVGRLSFSQSFINVQALSCLPGCSVSSEVSHLFGDEMRAWENHQKWSQCPAVHGGALQSLSVWSEDFRATMRLQLCWPGKLQHQWSIYFLKQPLAAPIGRVTRIMDTTHGAGDVNLFLGASQIWSTIQILIQVATVYGTDPWGCLRLYPAIVDDGKSWFASTLAFIGPVCFSFPIVSSGVL